MLGHCADSHTVCSPSPRASFLRLWKFSPTGAFARSHCGFGGRAGGARAILTNCEVVPISRFIVQAARPSWPGPSPFVSLETHELYQGCTSAWGTGAGTEGEGF